MNKKIIPAVLLLTLISLGILIIVYILRKPNDEIEKEIADKQETNVALKSYSFDQVGISFSAPADMNVDGEVTQDNTFTLTVQRGKYPDDNYYQLYGILQETINPTFDTESVKKDLEAGAKDTYIGGAKAVQGQYKGERNNLVTFIFTNKGIFKLSTTPSSTESGVITDNILKTLTFTFSNNPTIAYPATDIAIQSLLAKKYNKSTSDVKVTVNKEVPGFAVGSVLFGRGGQGEGGMWLAVMGNGWEVVWDGNGNVDCNKMRQVYGIPDTILKPNLCD